MEFIPEAPSQGTNDNLVFFKPDDRIIDAIELKKHLFEEDRIKNEGLEAIQERSLETSDQELECNEFEDNPVLDALSYMPQQSNPSRGVSLSRSETTSQSLGEDDKAFIDLQALSEEAMQGRRARAYFRKKWWLINPEAPPKRYWDHFVAVLITYVVVILPFKFGFYSKVENNAWDIVDLIIDAFFFIDIILTFFTPYWDHEELKTSLKAIAKNYLKFWFFLDLIAVFPFEYLIAQGRFVALMRMSRLPKLYRLVKISKLIRTFRAGRTQNNIWSQLYGMLKLSPSTLILFRYFQNGA